MSTQLIIYGSLLGFLVCTFLAVLQGNWKIISISWIAFLSMALAIPIGKRVGNNTNVNRLIAGYGLASGAMITSAAIFLVPTAINHDSVYGGLGIALGIIGGFAIHTLNHNLSHSTFKLDTVVLELTSHALSAGVIIGIVYAAMPQLGILLGIAIVSHKAPAGYAATRRLTLKGKSAATMILPASALGLVAMPVSLFNLPGYDVVNAVIFGFATGVFFHVAIDFFPECEVGGKIHQETELNHEDHHKLDKYRRRAVVSTFIGGLIVFIVWYITYEVFL